MAYWNSFCKKILAPWYFSALGRRTVHFGKAIKDKQEAGPADMERAALKEDWTVARLCAKERALRRLEIENIDWTTTAAVALHTGPPSTAFHSDLHPIRQLQLHVRCHHEYQNRTSCTSQSECQRRE